MKVTRAWTHEMTDDILREEGVLYLRKVKYWDMDGGKRKIGYTYYDGYYNDSACAEWDGDMTLTIF